MESRENAPVNRASSVHGSHPQRGQEQKTSAQVQIQCVLSLSLNLDPMKRLKTQHHDPGRCVMSSAERSRDERKKRRRKKCLPWSSAAPEPAACFISLRCEPTARSSISKERRERRRGCVVTAAAPPLLHLSLT